MSDDVFEFNRITFGLPIESYRVDAYITRDERLPVVTEYVLRLLKICNSLSLAALRDYFGFSDGETLSVIDSLKRQGLIETSGESIVLSNFALEKFEASGDDYPRFTKVESRRDTVTFDLLSFTPLPSKSNSLLNENFIRLSASDDFIGSSVEFAKAAYYKRFSEIALINDGLKKDAIDVYSVEDIQSKKRGYLPIPVSFSLNQEGQINRFAEASFEDGAAPELVKAFHEHVSEVFPMSQKADIGAFEQFLDSFDLPFLWKYVVGKSFDLYRYASELKSGAVTTPKGVRPLFGNLYLPHNAKILASRIRSQRTDARRKFLLTEAGWLAPDHEFWGRGESFQQAAHEFSSALLEKSPSDLHLFALAEPGQEQLVASVLRTPEIRHLHFFRRASVGDPTMKGRLEIFLYPTGFVAALYHLSIPGNSSQWAPVGFISALPKHTEAAHRLLELAAGGPNYGGRLPEGRSSNVQPQNPLFSDACGFLYFSDLRGKSPTTPEDDE
jgi:hypothetical protein